MDTAKLTTIIFYILEWFEFKCAKLTTIIFYILEWFEFKCANC